MELFFTISFFMFGLHLIFSFILLGMISDRSLVQEMFAVPNKWAGTEKYGIYLLKIKYFIPWLDAPKSFGGEATIIHFLFWVSRIAGTVFIISILAFLASPFFNI